MKKALVLVLALTMMVLAIAPFTASADAVTMKVDVPTTATIADDGTVNFQITFDTADQYFINGTFFLKWDASQATLVVPKNSKGQDDLSTLVGAEVSKMTFDGGALTADDPSGANYKFAFAASGGIEATSGTLFNLTFTLANTDLASMDFELSADTDVSTEDLDLNSTNADVVITSSGSIDLVHPTTTETTTTATEAPTTTAAPDKTFDDLTTLIGTKVTTTGHSADLVKAYTDALAAAKALTKDSSAADINAAYAALDKAITALKNEVVKTGDATPWALLSVAALAAAGLVVMTVKRKES